MEENVRNAWVDLETMRKNVELYQNQANITLGVPGAHQERRRPWAAKSIFLDILVGERDYISP